MQNYILDESNTAVLVVEKDINAKTYHEFEDAVNTIIENGIENLIISLKDIRYITSNAVGLLLETNKVLAYRNGVIILTDINEYVYWVLSVCGVDSVIKTALNIHEAVLIVSANKKKVE